MITIVDEALMLFVTRASDFLGDHFLEQPFLSHDGQHVLATDRKIAFRCRLVDATALYAELREKPDLAIALSGLIDDARNASSAGVSDLPDLPKAMACEACGGNGTIHPCPDCVGGEFSHGEHEYTCKTCCGMGYLFGDHLAEDQEDELICHVCHGSGRSRNQPIEVGCALISRRFLEAIAQLPGAKLANPVTATDPVYFLSDLGDGCVMPMPG